MRDQHLQGAHVVGEARHQLASLPALEEGQGKALEMAVEAQAQVVNEALAQDVADVQVAAADEAAEQVDAEQAGGQADDALDIELGDGLVDDPALEQRRQQLDDGDGEGQADGDGQRPPIGF